MEFRVCFTIAKYKNDMLLLCETIIVIIDDFCYSKIHFHQLGLLKFLHVLLDLSPVWVRYPKGSHKKGATLRSIVAYDEIKDRICNE